MQPSMPAAAWIGMSLPWLPFAFFLQLLHVTPTEQSPEFAGRFAATHVRSAVPRMQAEGVRKTLRGMARARKAPAGAVHARHAGCLRRREDLTPG